MLAVGLWHRQVESSMWMRRNETKGVRLWGSGRSAEGLRLLVFFSDQTTTPLLPPPWSPQLRALPYPACALCALSVRGVTSDSSAPCPKPEPWPEHTISSGTALTAPPHAVLRAVFLTSKLLYSNCRSIEYTLATRRQKSKSPRKASWPTPLCALETRSTRPMDVNVIVR